MTVIRPNSISGVSSITGSGGDISIFRADGTAADVIVNNITSGIITATTFKGAVEGNVTGSGANLTSIPAGQLTGTVADARLSTVSSSKLSGALPALDGSALTGVGVGTADSINTSGIVTATAFNYTGNQNLSNRNLIINGDFQVAQRATSSTSEGYGSVDRFRCSFAAISENPTQSQVDVSGGTTPYTLGFRKAFKIQNGNQTTTHANSNIQLMYRVESQDIANSGWNYTSSSSSITLSFWIKASVAQNYYGFVLNEDTNQNVFPFETGTLTANTWTKITKTIPGNSNLTFNNDTGAGLRIAVYGYLGTDLTGSMSLDTWVAYNHPSIFTPNQTVTWFQTNDATLEFTGFQLELGPVATPFEHRSYGDQLARCMRYYQTSTDDWHSALNSNSSPSGYSNCNVPFKVQMRAAPTVNYVWTGNGGNTPTQQSTNYIGVNSFVALSLANSNNAFRLDSWNCSAEI